MTKGSLDLLSGRSGWVYRPVDWLISASPMAARRWLKPSRTLCRRPSRASSLLWARSPGYDAIVIVEPLDRLIGLSEALE